MQDKGLCEICINDKDCTFPRRFPVLECKEYSTNGSVTVKKKIKKNRNRRASTARH